MQSDQTLPELIQFLRLKGYTSDFNIEYDCIQCRELGLKFRPGDFHVDYVHRFEGMTNPDDSAILYALSATDGTKGVLLDAFGVYEGGISNEMSDKLKIDKDTHRRWGDVE